jgi:hypothetical protein
MRTLAELKKTRTQIKATATRFKTFVQNFTEERDVRNLQNRLADFKLILSEFNKNQSEIEFLSETSDPAEINKESAIREQFEDQYYDTITLAENIIEERTAVTRPTNRNIQVDEQNPNITPRALQLPIINLPKFNGHYTEWTAFYDSFKSIIHENRNITAIEKFHYLRGCLLDDARRTIDALPVAARSYETAWTLLVDRYQNKRLITQQHMHELFNLQAVSNKSANSLRSLLDGVNTHLAALRSLTINTESWDPVLIYLVSSKIDFATKRDWETTLKSNELPTFEEFRAFLTQRCLTLESIQYNPINQNSKVTHVPKTNTQNNRNFPIQQSNPNNNCPKCKQSHSLYQCEEFLNLPINNRIDEVKRLKVCFNCLRPSHDAKSCRSNSTCKNCANKHHTLLHQARRQEINLNQSACSNQTTQIMLSTAVVHCKDTNGRIHMCRAMLDQGSQQHLITAELCNKLNLNIKPTSLTISGICESQNTIKESAQIEIKSNCNNYTVKIECLVVRKINSNFPVETFEKSDIPIPANLDLADPNFNISSGIDILIGAGLFWDILRDGRIKLSNNQTYIQNTKLGWILGGPFQTAAIQIHNSICCNLKSTNPNESLQKLVTKFWEVENFDSDKILTVEDQKCEDIFNQTHARDFKGKFILRLPFKSDPPNIGATRDLALKRFYALERKFKTDINFKTQYQNFMHEYISLNHMLLVEDDNPNDGCYLPHHGIIKFTGTQTKFRVVFDGSAKSSNGTALNDHLLVGPNLQKDIFSLLVHFRQYQYALSADVVKMFRQIWISQKHWKYQKVLWRSDPSEPLSIKAYGAVIYIRVTDFSDKHYTNILCSKVRIAPIKTITIPRLELCAALLLAELTNKVKNALDINFNNCFLWSDSSIVLAWIQSPPNKFETFIANRISQIQRLSDKDQWRHVTSNQNPADIASRSMDPIQLKSSDLWFHGPPFLSKNSSEWTNSHVNNDISLPEIATINLTSSCFKPSEFALFKKFSSFKKLRRVMAYCLRFINNLKKNQIKETDMLTSSELQHAETCIIKIVQAELFSSEINDIKSKGEVISNSHLKSLSVFLDKGGILRVGGRLQNSTLNFNIKHQILLPKGHVVTKLIIRGTHIEEMHAGVQNTLAAVRQKFWPIAGRNVVRQIIHQCVKCYRTKPTPFIELMGNLPSDRVTPARPFIHCGLDYLGPLQVKQFRGRGKKTMKCYVVVFICLATKAIHLELVYDYTTESFLNALKRMMARRGKVKRLMSDNGSNFVGANRALQSILKSLFISKEFQSDIMSYLTDQGIEWTFIPPSSPYMGGIWEAGVKSFKSHFKRVVGSLLITAEEMHTLLTLIESCLNSRPITPMSSDPNDLEPLTAGHFLIGAPLTAPIEPNLQDLPDNRLSRWQRIEK